MINQMYRAYSSNIYAQKSAMHIPVIALGLTRSTVAIVNSLLGEYSADEVEFFA